MSTENQRRHQTPPQAAPLVIAAVGDIMLGSAYPDTRDLPPHDGAQLLRPAHPYLSRADVTFGNLEGPLCDNGVTGKTGAHSFAFRVPTRYGRYLKAAGFDVLSLANNHASDFGAHGRETTRETLGALQIAHAGGDARDVAQLRVRQTRIAVVAFAHNQVSLNVNSIPAAQSAVADAASSADIVIVSFHGGGEGAGYQHVARGTETYLGESRGDLRRFARAVIDAGADLVLGHGPHVVRGMEVYKSRLIAYSLGNFATYGKFGLSGPTALSLVLEARLNPQTGAFLGGQIHPMKQIKPGGPLPDETGAVIPVISRLSRQDFGANAPQISKTGAIGPPAPAKPKRAA